MKNLGPKVSNELLHRAFSLFGSVERAVVLAEGERPRSKGEGIVEFSNKRAAQEALVACQEGHFVLTKTLVPVVVEPYEVMRTQRGCVEVFFLNGILLFRRIWAAVGCGCTVMLVRSVPVPVPVPVEC